MAAVLFGEVARRRRGRARRARLPLRRRRRPAGHGPGDGGAGGVGAPRAGRSSPRRRSRPWPTSTSTRAAVERELEPAAVEHPPAVVRRAHRRPPGEDLDEEVAGRRRAGVPCRSPTATVHRWARVTSTGRSTPPDTALCGAQRGGSPDEPTTPHSRRAVADRRRSCEPRPTASDTGSTSSCRTSPTRVSSGLDPADVPRAGRGVEAGPPPGPRGRQGAGRQAQPHTAALEAEDVEAAHGDPPGQGATPCASPASCNPARRSRQRFRNC